MKSRTGRALAGLLILALSGLVLAACGSSKKTSSSSSSASSSAGGSAGTPATSGPGVGKPAVTIGDKNFTEEFLLGQLYAQALEAKGFKVNLKPNIGSSEVIDKSLTSGQIDMYPEYTGVILSTLAAQKKQPASATAAYQQAKAFEAKRGFELLKPTPFTDSDVLIVKPAYAKQHNLHSLGDLKPLGKAVRFGGPPENATRYEGVLGLNQAYGVFPTFKPLAIGLQYSSLDAGQLDVATAFTTDGQLVGGKYVSLKDPKNIFGFQNVAPVVSKKVLDKEGPQFAAIIDSVSSKLTLEAVQKMNAAASIQKQDPAAIAKEFLKANGLV
ncbi:MAG: hypothetical protein NVSMB25_23560 [Thermoleophilaceae bacterium]